MKRLAFALILLASARLYAAPRPNVLFIAVDDLRPELACYGKQHIHSPNIDRLAARGVLFERAYCMVPTCGASRASLMTGIRPSRNRFVNYLTWAERDAPNAITLNQQFLNSGYTTISLGKVFHHSTDSATGWSEPAWRPKFSDWHDKQAHRGAIETHKKKFPNQQKEIRGLPFESYDAPDTEYRDGAVATKAIAQLEKFANAPDAPFFLAVGFFKPHLPFCAPKKYWDLYDEEAIKLPSNYATPKNVPQGATHSSGELRAYASIPPTGPVDDETAIKLIHGYYACVSFTDAQIGRLLDTLDRLDLADNTIVVLWGDHGWQLGEHAMWNKHSCFETSMHAPLIISSPDIEGGQRVAALVEFIDIYPSLCELAGIDQPAHLQGDSLKPLMLDSSAKWKQFAVGRYKSGDTIRSNSHRYSEFRDRRGNVTGRMLFDHHVDSKETVNVVSAADQQPTVGVLAPELFNRMGK